jgi:hypothetical protein
MKIKNNPRLIAWEILLLVASVFVFRGLWTLLDKIEWMSSTPALIRSLVIGIVLTVIAFLATQPEPGRLEHLSAASSQWKRK